MKTTIRVTWKLWDNMDKAMPMRNVPAEPEAHVQGPQKAITNITYRGLL